MSWDEYVNKKLLNNTDKNGHEFVNMCSEAGIVMKSGEKVALKAGFDPKEFAQAVKNKTSINCKGGKYIFLNQKENTLTNAPLYVYKRQNGGLIIGETTNMYIFATFDQKKKGKKDNVDKEQNIGDTTATVEELCEMLKAY